MVGMKSPWTDEWVDASGAATPLISPDPNFSGFLDSFFSAA